MNLFHDERKSEVIYNISEVINKIVEIKILFLSYFCTNWALCIVPTVPWLFDRFKPADRSLPLSPEVFNPPERRPSPEVFNNLEFAEVLIAFT